MIHGRSRVNESNEDLAFVHHINLVFTKSLVHQRLLDLENHLCTVINLLGIVNQFGASLEVIFIMIQGAVACVALYEHLKSVLNKFTNRFRCRGYTSFVVHDFLGNTNNHIV